MNTISNGDKIKLENGTITVPNNPIIPFIEGDGIAVSYTHLTLPTIYSV